MAPLAELTSDRTVGEGSTVPAATMDGPGVLFADRADRFQRRICQEYTAADLSSRQSPPLSSQVSAGRWDTAGLKPDALKGPLLYGL